MIMIIIIIIITIIIIIIKIESTQDPVEEIVNTLTTPEKELFERSSQLLASVNASEGDYSNRAIDTRIKQTPTKSDLKTINKVINGLVAQNKVVPGENPFAYLWLARIQRLKQQGALMRMIAGGTNFLRLSERSEKVIHRNSRAQQNKGESEVNKKREEKPLSPAKGVQVFVSVVARKLH